MPFRFQDELSSADVAFQAWGITQEELFAASAAALLCTIVDNPEQVERQEKRVIRLEHEELDLLLWSFLQELIFHKDAERLLLHADRVRIRRLKNAFSLEAVVSGEQIDAGRHHLLVDVKAVTLHRFHVLFEDDHWRADVVLDV